MECRVQVLVRYWGRRVEQLYETERTKHLSIISDSTSKENVTTDFQNQNRIIAFPDLIHLESRIHRSFDEYGISVLLDLFNPLYDQVKCVIFN